MYNVVTIGDKMCCMTEVCWEDGTEMRIVLAEMERVKKMTCYIK